MSLGIGIDTGGTYTDAVIYDFETKTVLGKGKSLTTKEDLAIGIGGAIDCLPQALLKEAKLLALSTTLATNACVENKGDRAKLVLLGTTKKVLEWIDAKSTYGLNVDEVLCIDTAMGTVKPDWDQIIEEHRAWLQDANALSLAAVGALQDGAAIEKEGREKLSAFGLPIVMGSEVAGELNVMERGATALLNSKLVPLIGKFMEAVFSVMEQRGVQVPAMVVRSDGSLMMDSISRLKPVETILSGPASSVLGGRGLTDSENCLIVDIGGTTTDISIVENNVPVMTGGIRIGGWRTQIKGVYIDTFGLGGDSRIVLNEGKLELSARRVEPLCAAAVKWPEIKPLLSWLVGQEKQHTQQLYEVLYLIHQPSNLEKYNNREQELIERLQKGPCMLGSGGLDLYNLNSQRLEDEGIVMRAGLTPTDIMHLKGDFSLHDGEASRLAARYLLTAIPGRKDCQEDLDWLCDHVYDLVCGKLYANIARVLMTTKYPELLKEDGAGLSRLIARAWEGRNDPAGIFGLQITSDFDLVGIGAPTHIFLPKVAEALHTRCIIPEHAEVANAVGAIIADIYVKQKLEISPLSDGSCVIGYAMYTPEGALEFETLEEAVEEGKLLSRRLAEQEARTRGAIGALRFDTKVNDRSAYTKDGADIYLGTKVVTSVSGRVEV